MFTWSQRWAAFLMAAWGVTLGTAAHAQVLEAPADARQGPVPDAAGTGAQVQFVRAFFGGYPPSLADAQQLIAGTAFVPAFDVWCGTIPYVDFTNATVRDSLGYQAPEVLCLPFLDPARSMPAATCRSLSNLPTGMYYENGGAAMRVRGLLAIRTAGTYTFAWGHDDGFGFYLGDTTVFEYVNPTGSRVDRRAVHFAEPGVYAYRLDWFDGGGGALLDWYRADGDHTTETWNGTDFHRVATEDLYPAGFLPCTPHCDPCGAEAPFCDMVHSRCVRCRQNADCGPCGVCTDGACSPGPGGVTTDGGTVCATDAGTPGADAAVGTPDVVDARDVPALDGGVGVPAPTGCGCMAQGRRHLPRGSAVAWAVLALTLARARRRPDARHGVRGGRS